MLAILLLAACGGGTQSAPPSGIPIDVSELPATLGQGFGQARLDGIDNQGGLNPGDVAPNFAIHLEDGRYLTLSDLQGRPVMINFWATWCGPCRLEMPDIVAAAEADANLVILAVNVQESMSAIGPFVEEYNMSMPVVRDPQGALRDLYGVRGMPTSVFIHPD
ncbi:MAG: TlpA family protein disulfide reductase, partial [Planctomycetes bacterium]|nr:TlpA family protein disulfide reductase [Planctomycetota bacterium]